MKKEELVFTGITRSCNASSTPYPDQFQRYLAMFPCHTRIDANDVINFVSFDPGIPVINLAERDPEEAEAILEATRHLLPDPDRIPDWEHYKKQALENEMTVLDFLFQFVAPGETYHVMSIGQVDDLFLAGMGYSVHHSGMMSIVSLADAMEQLAAIRFAQSGQAESPVVTPVVFPEPV